MWSVSSSRFQVITPLSQPRADAGVAVLVMGNIPFMLIGGGTTNGAYSGYQDSVASIEIIGFVDPVSPSSPSSPSSPYTLSPVAASFITLAVVLITLLCLYWIYYRIRQKLKFYFDEQPGDPIYEIRHARIPQSETAGAVEMKSI
eukprot:TRINITY_DN3253_c0_g2_i3.p2 TRINITY_DN3253_c0_g2~~TRINITY_DN3253_c0_g2_i3.p2  ORF type:complete len:145 (+),score=7.89 TRINITY_DN3253_c0_g2_i3:130-564(+)